MTARLCRHCSVKFATRSKGLCWKCSEDALIRGMYASDKPTGRRMEGDISNPVKQPGDKFARCLHCSRFRCDWFMQICEPCRRIYERAAVNMPAAGTEEEHEFEPRIARRGKES